MDLDEVFRALRARHEPVPRPHIPPTAAEVDEAERRLSLAFHPDFRRDLLEASDVNLGVIEPVTLTEPGSNTNLFKIAENAWDRYGVPCDLLPICEFNADFYCMNPAGEVVFWSHNGWSSESWSDLATWIAQVWLEDLNDA